MDERFLCVSISCDGHPVGILYVSVIVRLTRAVERSTSGHVMVKTDEYRMLNGQETYITDPCETVVHEIKTMTIICLWNKIRLHPHHHVPNTVSHFSYAPLIKCKIIPKNSIF